MCLLIREGCEAYGAEPSARLRELAAGHFPQLADRIYSGSLPVVSQQIGRKFDGILCAAVLQHVPEEQLFDAVSDIRNLLKPGGRLLLSFPMDRPGIDASGRDARGRLYTKLNPGALELLFERLDFVRAGRWEDPDSLDRPGYTWTTFLFTLECGGSTPPCPASRQM
jgi:SAM-dependent methyltransferase